MNAPMAPEALIASSVHPTKIERRRAALLVVAAVHGLLLLYVDTVASMVGTWMRSDTYAHGFFVPLVTAWLVWRSRARLRVEPIYPDWRAVPVLGLVGFGWLLARLASAQVLELYFFVAMVPVLIWGILGKRVVRVLFFPLAFLFLAVPFGDILIPPLINFTADFTVAALQATGVPVYREGNFFSVPSGNWSVVEACSGLRYLIASFTLGTLYAYLTFRRTTTRLLFVALAIIVPIFANGVRAYMIVMIAHLSSMRLAVGVDHLIYGWIFFGMVMLVLGWIGSFWRDDDAQSAESPPPSLAANAACRSVSGLVPWALACMAMAAAWSVYVRYLDHPVPRPPPTPLEITLSTADWTASPHVSSWSPRYVGSPVLSTKAYAGVPGSIQLHVAHYRNQENGSELINSGNALVIKNDLVWHQTGETRRVTVVHGREVAVRQNELQSATGKMLVWRWYWIAGNTAIDEYYVTAMLAWKRLTGADDDMAEIVIATEFDTDREAAAEVLQRFMEDALFDIDAELAHAFRS